MWKIQIFIFVEAILLTLAAITIVSIAFCSFCITILANKKRIFY